MLDPKAVTCQACGGTVYVRDERGRLVDTLSFPQNVVAQSFGNGISVVCGTMCYTYMLDNGQLKQVGIHGV